MSLLEHINEDGSLKDTFKSAAIEIAGDDFKDSKLLDEFKDIGSIVKSYLHTKSAFGKKLENVIQRPVDNASDEDKLAFRAELLKALGAGEKEDDYELPRIEGVEYGEQEEKNEAAFRKFFYENGWPVDMVKAIVEFNNQHQLNLRNAQLEAEQAAFDQAKTDWDKDYPGDKSVEAGRIAHAAVMEFADENLQKLLKDAKIYDSAGDLAKWRDIGIEPASLRAWRAIGEKMKSAESPGGGGGSEPSEDDKGGHALVGENKRYNHPTSKALAPRPAATE